MATRERMIVEALVVALRDAQVEDVAERVFEERGFSIPPTQMPAIDVMPVDGTSDYETLRGEGLRHELRVEIGVMVTQGVDEPPSAVADPIVAAVHQVVMQDASLQALVEAVLPGAYRWQRQDSGDGVVLRRSAVYSFVHVTEFDDLTAAAP